MVSAKKAKKQTIYARFTGTKQRLVQKTVLLLPKKTHHRWVAIGGGILLAAVIIFQLFYPSGRGLPFASVNGTSVQMMQNEQMAKLLNEKFAATKLKFTVGDKTVEHSLKQAGAEPNIERMIELLTNYPLWQRFIPGSILWQPAHIKTADVYFSNQQLKVFSEKVSSELSFPPQNARLSIKDGKLEATDSTRGSTVAPKTVSDVISSVQPPLGEVMIVFIPAKRQAAERTAKDLAKVKGEAQAALSHTVTIKAGEKEFTPSKSELASWIVLSTNEKGDVSLLVDKEKIKTYLGTIDKEVGTPAGQTNISIVDGRETGRTTGASGSGIAITQLVDQLAVDLLGPNKTITRTAEFVPVQPSVIFNSKYTATQAGLQAYIEDVARAKNMRISITQLDGAGWTANARANESIPSGSTYKLYVALVLFDRIDKGEIHWDDPMLDTTVAGCFERMTVASTNPCAESWIAQFGRQYINDFVHARGFSSGTSFTTGSANQTTAADLTKYMIGLNNGTLVSGANRDRLLSSLGRHPYTYGIPTGSQGIVHDKVGFLWDYIHDTAIVQHPQGTYIMTIMTKGQSYGAIASVTRQIERIMYP